MTITMLIVDDEPIICQGLRQTISWETIGVEVVGEAYDGLDALAFMEHNPVDVVLTDINMDGMDGLELSKQLKTRYPNARVVIISGYDHFEYARQALRLGIKDYLLKPVNIDELMTMVQRIGVEIGQEQKLRDDQQVERKRQWLNGQLQQGGADLYVDDALIVSNGSSNCWMIATQVADYAQWNDRSTEEVRREMRALWERRIDAALQPIGLETVSFFQHPNMLLTFVAAPLSVKTKDLYDALFGTLKLSDDVSLYASISCPFASSEHIRAACLEAISLLQYAVLLLSSPVILHDEERIAKRNHRLPDLIEMEKKLNHVLFQENEAGLDQQIGEIMREFRESGSLIKEVWHAFQELVIILQRKLRATGIDLSGYPDIFHTQEIDLVAHNSYRAMESLLRAELESMYALIHTSLTGKNTWLADRVKSYIEARYNKDLKASEIAAWLKITPNYFSILFKQKFGKGFAEYLNEVRIEQAKARLTGTDDRVFEIAESVGYKEYKYFCAIFKTYTGITPTQYRKLAHTT
ncbi:response regulator transcription factor [Paenibacillus aestuarii]|uniref:Response regulator n=1 Tax=Paenibacillus aestuarii TaxID=516965 RepID=A0ABW0K1W7_9BACL|nr:response regulator [Paenibacillus aestuarii]